MTTEKITVSFCCLAPLWWTSYNRVDFTGLPEFDHHTCQKCNKPTEAIQIDPPTPETLLDEETISDQQRS